MAEFIELPIDNIELDKDNPRIARGIAFYKNINSEVMALLLGSTAEVCAGLRESIRENKGIVHPIIVDKRSDGKYVVIEGNTRLQIYKDFVANGEPGDWTKIKAIVHNSMDKNKIHSIRLQAHLIGPREWDPYSKAKYLNYLASVEHMPMATLISFCGGSSKASEVKNMIDAYNDMELYYRPLCSDDSQFDIKKFHGFVELQNGNVEEALISHGYTKKDFSQWMIDERFSTLQDVRRIPDILKSKKASEMFLRENSREAKKILAVEEISTDTLKDVPYEILARELANRMIDFKIHEIEHLKDDSDYSQKLDSLLRAYSEVKFILEQVGADLQ